ncbi:uncharacterized protein C05D11.1-like [Liolophura sinensis]|uniref:uncharacterized protein C05D11.1-like n=1 Tax=Liolophura sinensis TaxID=3198878 RepID=UPI0031594474
MAMSGFDYLFTAHANESIPVSKYKSQRTGLSVFIAQVEGPLVNGYFCLATEAHNDDGLPHTLEHLVFMGSEDYPYKGVLDLLANRCLASGTNAWTDTDHTCYTMTTAGSEGFLKLMPIYLDHILYPTLTESGYITEVHHINGEGEDAGVVYCEMQARENSGESRCYLGMLREMYPGRCGYKSETGGIMENLRISTSHRKVCAYHHEFYRPENLCVIITGKVDPQEVFDALKPVEDKITAKGDRPAFTRPWQSPVPPLTQTVEKRLPYPSDEETHGMVYSAWRGPKAKAQVEVLSCMVLLEYLTETPIAPFQRDFVEINDPLCSKVGYNVINNAECCITMIYKNVPKEKLDVIKTKQEQLLRKLSTREEAIDMKRMETVIHKRILEALNSVEDDPHSTLAFICIEDFLFGDTQDDLEIKVNAIRSYRKMKSEPENFWRNLLNQYFVDKPYILIIGDPSKSLMEEMGQSEKDRIADQQKILGESGLKKKGDVLEEAIEENEKEAPEDVITKVAVPDVAKIQFLPIKPSNNLTPEAANKNEKFPLANIPFRFTLDDIQTNFVQMNALLDSTAVPQDLKYYLPLFCEVIFELPIERDGVIVPYEEVIAQLDADTLYIESSLGISGCLFRCGTCPQLAVIALKVEREKYDVGVRWLHEILYKTQFTADRLKIVATKMINNVASMKRKGREIVRTVLLQPPVQRSILHECNSYVTSMLRQHKFLSKLVEDLDKEPNKVLEMMEKVRGILTQPQNLRIHMNADVAQLAKDITPGKPWQRFVQTSGAGDKQRAEMKKTVEYIKPLTAGENRAVIVGVGSVESAFLIQVVPSISSPYHEDLPAVMVFIQYLSQCEGPMWRQIRGLGLSYHYSIYTVPETGQLYFILSKSTHIISAYKQGKDIVLGYADGRTPFSEVELESSRSSLIFEIIESEKTASSVSMESMLSYFTGVDHNYNKELMEKIAKVTIDDLKRVGPKYLAPLFEPSQFRVSVCCHPTKVEEICNEFKELGVELKVLPSLDDSSLVDP